MDDFRAAPGVFFLAPVVQEVSRVGVLNTPCLFPLSKVRPPLLIISLFSFGCLLEVELNESFAFAVDGKV